MPPRTLPSAELEPTQQRGIRVTKTQRERHTLPSEIPYSHCMERVFVVRLGSNTEPMQGRFDGLVEDVDTGQELRFRSADELLRFLGQCFDEALRRHTVRTLCDHRPGRPPDRDRRCAKHVMRCTRDRL